MNFCALPYNVRFYTFTVSFLLYIQPGTYNTSLIQHFYWWLKQWFSVTGFIAIHRNTRNITNFIQFCLREQNSNIRKTESLWSWHDTDCTRLIVYDYNQRQFVLKQFNEVHLLCLISRMYINKYSFILDVLLKTFYLHNSMWCSNTTYVQRCPSHAQWKQKVRHIIRAACSKYCVSAFSENGHFRAKKLPTEKFL